MKFYYLLKVRYLRVPKYYGEHYFKMGFSTLRNKVKRKKNSYKKDT